MDEEYRNNHTEKPMKNEDPLDLLMDHNLAKINLTVSDGLVDPDHIKGRFASDQHITEMGSRVIDRGGYAEAMRYYIASAGDKAADKYSVGIALHLGQKATERNDKGYFAAHRRSQVKRLLESKGYSVVPYDQEVQKTGIRRYGLHISKDSVKYDLHFGYQTETDAIAAAVSRRRKAQIEAGKTSNQMITLSSEPAELDEKGKYIQSCANTAKDFLSAILTESGEKIDDNLDITFR